MGVWPQIVGIGIVAALCMAAAGPRAASSAPPLNVANDHPVVSDRYLEHFQGVLNEGFRDAPSSLKTAEQHFQAAQRLNPDDPRLEYAYGLVLLKNLKYTDGVALITAAADSDPPYLPASRARIRELIRRGKHADALDELITLAEVLRNTNAAPDADKTETARWMGLAIGFFSGPNASEHSREQAKTADTGIRQRLPQELVDPYELGQQDVRVIEGQLEVEQKSAEKAAQLKREAQKKEDAARSDSYRDRQDKLLDTKEKWDAWFADTSNELDSQLDQLGDRFDTLNRSVTSLIESIQAAQLDMRRLDTMANLRRRANPGRNNQLGSPILGPAEQQLLARSQELNAYVGELSLAMKQRELVTQQAQRLLAQRAAAERRYRNATGSVAKQVSRVKKWDERLKTAMQQKQNNPASSRKLKALTSRAQSFSTYDSFELEAEQNRMLHIYDKPAD